MVRRFSRSAKVSSTAMALLVLIALGFVFVLAGCGDDPVATTVSSATEASASGSPTTGGAAPQELTVSAASSLKAAFTEIGAAGRPKIQSRGVARDRFGTGSPGYCAFASAPFR